MTTAPTALATAAPPRPRLPEWLRLRLPQGRTFSRTRALLEDLRLHTVCESAQCPNHWECWDRGTATFMIGGDLCTRHCRFCAVKTGRPQPLDPDEPHRVAEATHRLHLRHVVITAVTRDDLPDGGAEHFRQTVEAVRAMSPATVIEILTPDFNADDAAIAVVLSSRPAIFNHNLETVRRLTPQIRSRATYERSLAVLRKVGQQRRSDLHLKSGLMVGLGERVEEVMEAIQDLRAAGCEMLTLGQYLQPTRAHHPVVEYVTPTQFDWYGQQAVALGFRHVASAPMVRSSYHAAENFESPPTARPS